jgi:hypothetical protein
MKKKIVGLWIAAAVMLAVIAGCSVAGQPQVAASVSITSAPTTPTTKTTTKPSTTRSTPPTTAIVTSTRQQQLTVTETSTAQVVTSVAQWVPPAGFDDWGGHIAARGAETNTFECTADSDSCWGVDVFTEYGCGPSVYVAIDVFKGSDNSFVTTLNTLTPPLGPNSQTVVVIGETGLGDDLTAQISDVHCTNS